MRGELVLAAILCGQGTDYTGAGITTVLGHAIGARHELENGIVNAIVLPHVLRFNADAAAAGLAKVAAALGLPRSEAAVAAAIVADGDERSSTRSACRAGCATSACRAKRCRRSPTTRWATGSCAAIRARCETQVNC